MVGEKNYKKFAKPLFIILLVITVALGFLIPNIRFDYDFEKFFPAEDAETKYYFKHREVYQSDNDFLLIAIEREDGIFNRDFLNRVEKLRQEVEDLRYVNFARAITNEKELFLLTGGIIGRKPYYSNDARLLESDSTRIYKHHELLNNLIAKDGKSLCIFIKHEEFLPYCVEQSNKGEKRDALTQAEADRIIKLIENEDWDSQPPYISIKSISEKTAPLAPECVANVKVNGNKGVDIEQKAIVNNEDELLVPDPDQLTWPVIKPIGQTVHQMYGGCLVAATLNLYAFVSGKLPGFSASASTAVFKADAERFGGGTSVDEDEIFLD